MKRSFPKLNSGFTNVLRITVVLTSHFNVLPAITIYTDYVPFVAMNIASGIDLATYKSFDGCNIHCNQNPNCIGFVIGLEENCWLKSINSNIEINTGVTSFYQVQSKRVYTIMNGMEYQGTLIFYYQGPLASCQQACDALTGCVGYVMISIHSCNMIG